MTIFFFLIVCVSLWGLKFNLRGFNTDFLDKRITSSFNGIFILWVFLRHTQDYIGNSGYQYLPLIDSLFFFFDDLFGQRIVVLFLFFSGYGVMESIKNKGELYISSFPKCRIFTTWLNFVIAVCAFIAAAIILGRAPGIKQVLLSLIAWNNVGNSDWYVFAILMCYLTTFLSFRLPKSCKFGVLYQFLMISLVVVCLFFTKGFWWYDTILAYSLGMCFSRYRRMLEPFLKRYYIIAFLLSIVVTACWKFVPMKLCGIERNVPMCGYAVMMILLLMKVRIYNKTVEWLGAHLFPIYIYQRLPMILIAVWCGTSIAIHPYLFIAFSALLTYGIAALYHHWQVKFK